MKYDRGYRCQIPGLDDIYMDTFGYKTSGHFVEVGAFDCYTWSNTWSLAMAGWTGLYFEPQPELVSKCKERYTGMDNITIRQLALSNMSGKAELYLGGSLSTLSKRTRDMYMGIPWARSTGHADEKTMLVDVSTLDIELEKLAWPPAFDVLVIDVEGSEVDVLNGFSIAKWRPHMCIVEAHEGLDDNGLGIKAHLIDVYFELAGYDKIYSDTINSIYKMGISPHVKEHES